MEKELKDKIEELEIKYNKTDISAINSEMESIRKHIPSRFLTPLPPIPIPRYIPKDN